MVKCSEHYDFILFHYPKQRTSKNVKFLLNDRVKKKLFEKML